MVWTNTSEDDRGGQMIHHYVADFRVCLRVQSCRCCSSLPYTWSQATTIMLWSLTLAGSPQQQDMKRCACPCHVVKVQHPSKSPTRISISSLVRWQQLMNRTYWCRVPLLTLSTRHPLQLFWRLTSHFLRNAGRYTNFIIRLTPKIPVTFLSL